MLGRSSASRRRRRPWRRMASAACVRLASTIAAGRARPRRRASRLGLDWRKGARRMMQTANGATPGYVVVLDRVRVGGIELQAVDGVVVEHGLGIGLLGMSFLNRVEMQRDGDR